MTVLTGLIAVSSVIAAGGFQDLAGTSANPEGIILIAEAVLVLLIPFIFLAIYFIFGKEKNVTVPEYLSTIPNKNRTPFEVNLLFKGSAFVSDHDAFYATLLDLHRKKKISITGKGNEKDVLIKIVDNHGDSDYEQRVLDFLLSTRNMSGRGVVDTESLDRLIKKVFRIDETKSQKDGRLHLEETDKIKFRLIKSNLNSLMGGSSKQYSDIYAVNGSLIILPFLVIGIIVFLFSFDGLHSYVTANRLYSIYQIFVLYLLCLMVFFIPVYRIISKIWNSPVNSEYILYVLYANIFSKKSYYNPYFYSVVVLMCFVFPIMILSRSPEGLIPLSGMVLLSGSVVVQAYVGYSAPPTLFGHWKGDYYREKLEWIAFRDFLTDLSNPGRYKQSDIDKWGEWLVYGTALGAGPEVSRMMQKLGLHLDIQGMFFPDYSWFSAFQNIYDS